MFFGVKRGFQYWLSPEAYIFWRTSRITYPELLAVGVRKQPE